MSSTTTSGCSISAASSAAGPLLTAATIAHAGVSVADHRVSIASLSSAMRTRTGSNEMLLDGILNQFGRARDLELFHHLVSCERHRSRRDVQNLAISFIDRPSATQLNTSR
jgi:hypothetical protein